METLSGNLTWHPNADLTPVETQMKTLIQVWNPDPGFKPYFKTQALVYETLDT